MRPRRSVATSGACAVMSGLFVLIAATGARAQSAPAGAEPAGPDIKRLTVTASFDIASAYVFRGLLQGDQGVITWPAADVGLTLIERDGLVQKLAVNFGTWNSLHSGPTGSAGPSGEPWYESDFYTAVGIGLGRRVTLGTIYTAYTSPNSAFGTVREIALKLAVNDARAGSTFALAPYALVAFELDGQADAGEHQGRYLELGVAPAVSMPGGRVTLSFPVKLGLSLKDYYEGPSPHDTFGYLDTGVVATLPLRVIPSRFGSWNVHGGVSLLTFGANTEAVNRGDGTKVVGSFGAGLSY